jgi:uncharacterized protein
MILIDAGPLVALLHADDQWHDACVRAFRKIKEPLGTVWPVFTEAMYLLSFSWKAQQALWELLDRRAVSILSLDVVDAPRMCELMKKYQDLPMDFADAALVRVAEREKIRKIFTVDRTDFQLYRPLRIGRFSILPGLT